MPPTAPSSTPPTAPLVHLLLETMATEPDLPTVLKTLHLTLEEAWVLLNSPEGRARRAQIRRECLAQCKAITQRMAPKLLHKLANLAIDECAPPEIQLQATQSLLKILTLNRSPLTSSRLHPRASPRHPPNTLPKPPPAPYTLIVNHHLALAAQQIAALANNTPQPPT